VRSQFFLVNYTYTLNISIVGARINSMLEITRYVKAIFEC